MEKLIITGVPEHFNYPWIEVVASQPFMKKGIELVWRDEPMGSGAMNCALRERKTDLAIVLTESFIKDKVEGNPGEIIGMHVRSPLTWGIHAPKGSTDSNLSAFENAAFLISRMGSGSHLMAYILAKREGWDIDKLKFEIVRDLNGALEHMKEVGPKLFLWEKFTTKPSVDRGFLKRIGEIPTPWPCFVIVAHEASIERFGTLLGDLRDLVYEKSIDLRKEATLADQISKTYHIQLHDVNRWLGQTEWASNNHLSKIDIEKTQQLLWELQLIEKTLNPIQFTSTSLAVLDDL